MFPGGVRGLFGRRPDGEHYAWSVARCAVSTIEIITIFMDNCLLVFNVDAMLFRRVMERAIGTIALTVSGASMWIVGWVIGVEWMLLHRCERCTTIRANRIAPDDDLPALLSLAARPLADPPIPAVGVGGSGAL